VEWLSVNFQREGGLEPWLPLQTFRTNGKEAPSERNFRRKTNMDEIR